MTAFWIIVLKEIRDNLRDRRSMFFTLMYGPLLLPALMVGPLVFKANQHSIDVEQSLVVSVVGAERAPNLVRFLAEHNIEAAAVDADELDRVRQGESSLVLEVTEAYPEAIEQGKPAPLVLHYNSSEGQAEQQRRRLRRVLDGYDQQLQKLRLLARGMDPALIRPLDISDHNMSSEPRGEAVVGLLLPFLLLFSMMVGGFYLAVDSTAGERERLSLEPLLALPVSRVQLVLGKYTAVLSFVLASLILPLSTSLLLFSFLPDGGFSSVYDFSWRTFLLAGVIQLPVAVFLTALLLVIAAFARSTKEAQTQIGLAMVVPMIPFFALQFMDVPRTALTASIPLLGQYQLMESVVRGVAPDGYRMLASSIATLVAGAVLLGLTVHRYRQESILQ